MTYNSDSDSDRLIAIYPSNTLHYNDDTYNGERCLPRIHCKIFCTNSQRTLSDSYVFIAISVSDVNIIGLMIMTQSDFMQTL